MRKNHDGITAFQPAQVLLEPVQLRLTQLAHTFQLDHIHQSDEVHSLVIEAVPAVSFGFLAVPVKVHLAVVDGCVMLARYIEDLLPAAGQNLCQSVEFGGLRAVREIARVDEKIRGRGACANPVQSRLERCGDVCVGRLVEANMAVADLYKAKVCLTGGVPRASEGTRHGHSSHETPNHSGARPCHAFQEPTAI